MEKEQILSKKRIRQTPLNPRMESKKILAFLGSNFFYHPFHGHSFSHREFCLWSKCGICSNVIWEFGYIPWLVPVSCKCLNCGMIIHRSCIHELNSSHKCKALPINQDSTLVQVSPQRLPKRESNINKDLDLSISKRTEDKKHSEADASSKKRRLVLRYFRKYGAYVAGGLFGGIIAGPMGLFSGIGSSMAIGAASNDLSLKGKDSKASWAKKICAKFRKQDISILSPKIQSFFDNLNTQKPNKGEVQDFLFAVLAHDEEPLSKMNMALCMKFQERYHHRVKSKNRHLCEETVEDAFIYIGHVLAVLLDVYPLLTSTEQTIATCSYSVEKILFADIYPLVFSEFKDFFCEKNALLQEQFLKIKEQLPSRCQQFQNDFAVAIEYIKKVNQVASPSEKLAYLSQSFVEICQQVEERSTKPPNADEILPIICDVLVQSRLQNSASEISFITVFTSGGGRGIDGYTLTTFQSCLNIISSIDPKELVDDSKRPHLDSKIDESEYYDAIADLPAPSIFCQIDPSILHNELVHVCGDVNPYPYSLQEEIAYIRDENQLL